MAQRPEILAIILGGGRGKRMSVLTRKRAKPSVSFGGKYRIIDWTMSNCARSNVADIWILTQFRYGSLSRHLANGHTWNYDERYLRLISPEERDQDELRRFLGTADAVRSCLEEIHDLAPDLVLILAGDHIYSTDYQHAVRTHLDTRADLTVYLHPIDRQWVSGMGLVNVDPQARIVEFVEKPSDPQVIDDLALTHSELQALPRDETISPEYQAFLGMENQGPQISPSHLASMGIYICSPRVLKEMLEGPENDFGSQILPQQVVDRHIQGQVFWGYWRDVGAVESFYWAHQELLRPVAYGIFNPYLTSNPRDLPSPMCHGELTASVVSEGCMFQPGSRVSNSTMGYNVIVDPEAIVEDSILLGADRHAMTRLGRVRELHYTHIQRGAHLRRVILDKNLQIAPGVSLGVEPLDVEERRRRLTGLGLVEDRDFALTESGLLVMAKPEGYHSSPFPEDFVA